MEEYTTAALAAAFFVAAALTAVLAASYLLAVAAGFVRVPDSLRPQTLALLEAYGADPAAGHKLHLVLTARQTRQPQVYTVLSVRLLDTGRLQYSTWRAGADTQPRRFCSALNALIAYYTS